MTISGMDIWAWKPTLSLAKFVGGGTSQNLSPVIPCGGGLYHSDVFMVIVPFSCHHDDLWQYTRRTITLVRKDWTNISRTVAVFKLIPRERSYIKDTVSSQKSQHWEWEMNTVLPSISYSRLMPAGKRKICFLKWNDTGYIKHTSGPALRTIAGGQQKTESINQKHSLLLCVLGGGTLCLVLIFLSYYFLFVYFYFYFLEREERKRTKETERQRQRDRDGKKDTERNREHEVLWVGRIWEEVGEG